MGTPAAPVAESDPSAPLSCDPSRLTPMQATLALTLTLTLTLALQ